ncbi:Crp/Fnr family transcriptional regulator [Ornithinibacillus scapharcae]|uniref:Crp/Fnr family transcriptional regulator n=1 Tax=Ornithinibacillus scapharcae TaxID=1147159 RepID=UPI000225AFEA|nr:Crp/Fnr family transcriptional regulator [Ornithinibacillus scapharcae]
MLANFLIRSQSGTIPTIPHPLIDLIRNISTIKRVQKDTYLFQEGIEANEIYYIQSGLIQISKLNADGKEITLRICSQHDLVGELSLFSPDPQYTLSGKVLSAGEVLVISKGELEEALLTNTNLALEYMKWSSIQLRKYQSKLRDLLFNGKKGALYSTLIRLSNSYGTILEDGILIDITLTNQDLANFCGATRESVNRMLVDLRKLDILSTEQSGKILIKNLEYLKTAIYCENCPIEICNIN